MSHQKLDLQNTTEPWTPPLQQCKGPGPETCFSSVRQSAGQSETNVSHGGGADSPKQLLLGSRIVTFCQLQRPSDVVTICQLHRPSKSKVNNYEATEGLSSGRLLLVVGRVSSVSGCACSGIKAKASSSASGFNVKASCGCSSASGLKASCGSSSSPGPLSGGIQPPAASGPHRRVLSGPPPPASKPAPEVLLGSRPALADICCD